MEKKIYLCELCNYKTNKLFNFKRHQNAIHEQKNNNIENEQNDIIKGQKDIIYEQKDIIYEQKNIIDGQKNIIKEQNDIIEEKINSKKKVNELFCEKCNKKYLTKKHLNNHLKKCNGLDSLTCPRCMKHFSTHGNKSIHIKKNNCKPKSIIHATNNNIINSNCNNNNNNNNNNTNCNNTTINNTIVNNYGSERTDFITFDDMIRILELSGNLIIPKYIEFKHFNENFPENHNIKYEKNNECLVKRDGKWKITDLDYISKNLMINNSTEINKYYIKEKYKIENKIQNLDTIEFIVKRFNYLDLNIDRQIYNSIKTEIKDIIKSSRV